MKHLTPFCDCESSVVEYLTNLFVPHCTGSLLNSVPMIYVLLLLRGFRGAVRGWARAAECAALPRKALTVPFDFPVSGLLELQD